MPQSIFSQAFDFSMYTPVNTLITIIILLAAGVMRLVFHTFFLDICCVLKSFMGDWDACNGSVLSNMKEMQGHATCKS